MKRLTLKILAHASKDAPIYEQITWVGEDIDFHRAMRVGETMFEQYIHEGDMVLWQDLAENMSVAEVSMPSGDRIDQRLVLTVEEF